MELRQVFIAVWKNNSFYRKDLIIWIVKFVKMILKNLEI